MASRIYKAKRKNWKELPKEKWWVEGAIFEGKENSYIITNVKVTDEWEDSEIGADVIGYLVDPETVCQYTGLTDKNGSKIFEGDIVKVVDTSRENQVFGIGDICFEESMWKLCGEILHFLEDVISFEFEVIGNIFDNPELMER